MPPFSSESSSLNTSAQSADGFLLLSAFAAEEDFVEVVKPQMEDVVDRATKLEQRDEERWNTMFGNSPPPGPPLGDSAIARALQAEAEVEAVARAEAEKAAEEESRKLAAQLEAEAEALAEAEKAAEDESRRLAAELEEAARA